MFDLSDRTQLELTGRDRAKFLHNFSTNDIKALVPGRGCEAFVCNVQGKVLGHLFVFCTETSLWIDSVSGQEDALFAHLDRYLINEDVQIHRRSANYGDLYVDAASLSEFSEDLANAMKSLADQPLLSHVRVSINGEAMQIRSVDWLGEPAWLMSAPKLVLDAHHFPSPLEREGGRKPHEGEVTDAVSPDIRMTSVTSPSPPASLPPGERGETAFNTLRIAAGFPLYGIDITSDNLAQEVNRTARAISFTKGCYLGQEPIARIDALGHVNRELHRLEISAPDSPSSGTALLDPQSKTQVGVITSAARLLTAPEKVAALGYLRTKFCAAGTNLVISSATGDVFASVI